MDMKCTSQKQLESIRKTLIEFWTLLNNSENAAIYESAYIHGVKLSDAYVKKIMPLNRKLKKFMRIK
jgi:hypothetical protein